LSFAFLSFAFLFFASLDGGRVAALPGIRTTGTLWDFLSANPAQELRWGFAHPPGSVLRIRDGKRDTTNNSQFRRERQNGKSGSAEAFRAVTLEVSHPPPKV